MTRQEIESAKEGGRRRLLSVRLPALYGLDARFTLRTLLRGEILAAFAAQGHPEQEIPEAEHAARVRFEDAVAESALLETPPGFHLPRAPAGLAAALSGLVLERSGFTEGGPTQAACLSRASAYAHSAYGRADALIQHYFPGVRDYDLDALSLEEWHRKAFQAILVARSVDGVDLVPFLSGKDVTQAPTDAPAPPAPESAEATLAQAARGINPQALGLRPDAATSTGATVVMAGRDSQYDFDRLRARLQKDLS